MNTCSDRRASPSVSLFLSPHQQTHTHTHTHTHPNWPIFIVLLCQFSLASPLSPPPILLHNLSHKKPLTRRTKFHWPSFVDLSGTGAVCLLEEKKKKSFNIVCWACFAVGRWRTVVPKTPQTHRKRVCHLLHDLSRCRDKAQ